MRDDEDFTEQRDEAAFLMMQGRMLKQTRNKRYATIPPDAQEKLDAKVARLEQRIGHRLQVSPAWETGNGRFFKVRVSCDYTGEAEIWTYLHNQWVLPWNGAVIYLLLRDPQRHSKKRPTRILELEEDA